MAINPKGLFKIKGSPKAVHFGEPMAERYIFIRNTRLCFGCFGPDHISRKCRQGKQCRVCLKFHPTSLHGDQTKQDSTATKSTAKPKQIHDGAVFLNDASSASKCSMIVPEQTCNDLGLNGVDVQLSLSKMYAENKVVDSQRYTCLMISYGQDGETNIFKLARIDIVTVDKDGLVRKA
ncbi:LOW QUALITY PROTEIN: hypothetical protein MAR_019984 [Mya arenaria]|uniref:CCHC-type domain-containing protein n=1 Tax=Mya arenaria TaxID=6604 RepID=A0ABY7E6Q6_MYAAR|nr:LOW QUALITY PROTEIN: hypothetical protein MAR_019984 [Mya arenaria]